MGRHSVTDYGLWQTKEWWTSSWMLTMSLLVCTISLIYDRDHGRWSQALIAHTDLLSCLFPWYSSASCTKSRSHVLLTCKGPPKGAKTWHTWNVIYTCIHMYMKLRIECDYQASLHSAITFVHSSLVPRPLPSFQLLPHSMQWKDGWEPGNKTTFCIEYIAVSELVSKWPRTMTILWLVQTSFHSMEPVSLNSVLSVCIYSLQRKTRLR